MDFRTDSFEDFSSFIKNFDQALVLLHENREGEARKIWDFLRNNEIFLDPETLGKEDQAALIPRLQELDISLLEMEHRNHGGILSQKPNRIANLIHQKISAILGFFDKLPIEMQRAVLLALPSRTPEETKTSAATFLELWKENPDFAKEAFAQWISERELPIAHLGIFADQLLELGPYLRHLNLEHIHFAQEDIESLDFQLAFPQVKELRITHSYIRSIKNFPPQMEIFKCNSCVNLRTLPPFPETLKEFSCAWCYNLLKLPSFENTRLEKFNSSSSGLTQWPAFPPTLQEIDCSHCYKLQFPEDLNLKNTPLKKLHCSQCHTLRKISEVPGSLEELVCDGCPLPTLPKLQHTHLKKLDCHSGTVFQMESSSRLRALPPLPQSIEHLNIQGTLIRRQAEVPGLSDLRKKSNFIFEHDETFLLEDP